MNIFKIHFLSFLLLAFILNSQNEKVLYSLKLKNGLFCSEDEKFYTPEIEFYHNEKIASVESLDYNASIGYGFVDKFNDTGNKIEIEVFFYYPPDQWRTGGIGDYKIEIFKKDDILEGEYVGKFIPLDRSPKFAVIFPSIEQFSSERGPIDLKGTVHGKIIKKRVFSPQVMEKEHPRLLLRKSDISKIKEKIEKGTGKVIYEKIKESNDPVCLGFLYLITGDKKYADRCKEEVESMIKDFTPGPFNLGHAHGERLRKIAIAYDFCYDGWDEEFKNRVRTYISYLSERILLRPYSLSSKVNTHPCSNYSAKIYPGGLIGILALLGETWDKFPEIDRPVLKEVKPIEYTKSDVIWKFNNLQAPENWLFAGPFERFSSPYDIKFYEDLFLFIKGNKITPEEISVDELKVKFSNLDKRFIKKEVSGSIKIDIIGATNRKLLSSSYYLSFIDNDKERFVKLNIKGPQSEILINGEKFLPGDILKMEKGLYYILIKVYTGLIYPWATSTLEINFEEVDEKTAKEEYERKEDLYIKARFFYERLNRSQLWEKEGKDNILVKILEKIGEKRVSNYCRYGIGEWGWNTEGDGYTYYSCDEPMLASTIFRNVKGFDLAYDESINKMPILTIGMTLMNGKFEKMAYGGGASILQVRHILRIFPIIPDIYKPGIIWYLNKLRNISIEETKDPEIPEIVSGSGEDLVLNLLNLPEDIKPKSPEEIFPKFIFDKRKGGFVFRNSYSSSEDIIASIFIKSQPVGPGWQMNNAGDFRIWGLGEKWFIQGASNKNMSDSSYQNVIQISGRKQNGLGGDILDIKNHENFSSIIKVDLSDAYKKFKEKLPIRTRYGEKIKENLIDDVKVIRIFGVDYSKISGVDGLFVIADYIKYEGEKLWQAVIGDNVSVEIKGNEFLMSSKNTQAKLKGIFIPSDINLSSGNEVEFENKKYSPFGKNKKLLFAKTNGDLFLTIMILQKKDLPEIKIKKDNEKYEIEINKRKILFSIKDLNLEFK